MKIYIDNTDIKNIVACLKQYNGNKKDLVTYATKREELLLDVNEPKLSFDTNWIIGDGASSYVGTALVGVSYIM